MEAATTTLDNATAITGIPFVSVYVGDYAEAFTFYHEVLGLEKQMDMGEKACFFRLGADLGLYLEGGNDPVEVKRDSTRSTFTLGVESASAMYDKLKAAGARMIHVAPMDMGEGGFWFQFCDPSGNILEILGGR